MGKLRVLSGREVCQILEQHGFIEVRQRGSHIIMMQKRTDTTITVPVPNYSELHIGTLQSIFASLDCHALFLRLLDLR